MTIWKLENKKEIFTWGPPNDATRNINNVFPN
jgi:hypothetical protein